MRELSGGLVNKSMTLAIPPFSRGRVVVAGDVMLDRYWFGPTSRISPEAPVPVVRVQQTQERPGGAANVAVNLASLGVQTSLLGVTGEDEAASRLQALLSEHTIACNFLRSARVPTITKLRVLSRNQQLIRLDFESTADQEAAVRVGALSEALAECNAVILSDYGKGALADCASLISLCRERAVPVLVDPKGRDFDRYRGATALTPNLAEFEAVVGSCSDDHDLAARAESLRISLGLDYILITRSERGMSLVGKTMAPLHLPAEAREVYDVTGAGDTVIATLGASLAAGASMADAAALANLAAGLVVRKLGVASVTPSELRMALHQRGKGGRGLMGPDEIVRVVREAQSRGERVLMTNGCFDILHAGHIAYLEEAKSLGDRLVVAVNDDDSVRRLKGGSRPINKLEDRMAVLAGLAAVDWVVPFSEDTPEALICRVLPDVLVKGGDYRPDEIAGADCVLSNGGEVKVLTYREGRSTSAIIEAIRHGST